MALMVAAQVVPASAAMALPHGPAGVGVARRRLRAELIECGAAETVVDDAVLIMSELLSNSYRHARPLGRSPHTGQSADVWTAHTALDGADLTPYGPQPEPQREREPPPGTVLVAWRIDTEGLLTLEVTDGGGPTRPTPANPSITARGGRGLDIVRQLSLEWGVRDAPGEVTVWAVLAVRARHARRTGASGGLVGGVGVSSCGKYP